jgi:hypothetical protein
MVVGTALHTLKHALNTPALTSAHPNDSLLWQQNNVESKADWALGNTAAEFDLKSESLGLTRPRKPLIVGVNDDAIPNKHGISCLSPAILVSKLALHAAKHECHGSAYFIWLAFIKTLELCKIVVEIK